MEMIPWKRMSPQRTIKSKSKSKSKRSTIVPVVPVKISLKMKFSELTVRGTNDCFVLF